MNALVPFDYSGVPVEHSQVVRDAATRIKCRMARTALDIVEIGRDLIEVKKAIGHGHFLKWIEIEFGMSDQTARNFTNAADAFGSKSKMILDLPPTVLYALAAPSTPDEVRQVVIEKIAAGEKVTAADVKELKAKLADKDDKLRSLKSQKRASEEHNGRLIDEIRSKSNECERLVGSIADLREELRRATEPNTMTVVAVDITPWTTCAEMLWNSAPPEARKWITDYVAAERSE